MILRAFCLLSFAGGVRGTRRTRMILRALCLLQLAPARFTPYGIPSRWRRTQRSSTLAPLLHKLSPTPPP